MTSFLRAVMNKVRKVAKERNMFNCVKALLLITKKTGLKIGNQISGGKGIHISTYPEHAF